MDFIKPNIALLLIIFSLLTEKAVSQDCVVDKSKLETTFSLSPSKQENLRPAAQDQEYMQTISFKFPNSTSEILDSDIIDCPSYLIGGVTIRDVKISAMEGLPAGIVYECNSPDCFWEKATYGAVCLKGTPETKGEYNVTVTVEGIANVLFMPMTVGCTLSGYKIVVE